LARTTNLPLGICWLLTENDAGNDGDLRRYLLEPNRWRARDPVLFDALRQLLNPGISRDIRHLPSWGLLPNARYYDRFLVDDPGEREQYFVSALSELSDHPLLFFDPDNGIEVRSVPFGRRGSSKYLYWHEIEHAYGRGHSLVIYQHFPRRPRAPFIAQLARSAIDMLCTPKVYTFATSHVLFLILVRPEHVSVFSRLPREVEEKWADEIRVVPTTAGQTEQR